MLVACENSSGATVSKFDRHAGKQYRTSHNAYRGLDRGFEAELMLVKVISNFLIIRATFKVFVTTLFSEPARKMMSLSFSS